MIRIPPAVDLELHAIAERAAGDDTTLIDAMGWTRGDFVAAIHARLRVKWREMREVA